MKAVLEERQRAAYIQNQEMQISQKLAEMFKLVSTLLKQRLETTSKHVLFGWHNVLNNSGIRCQYIKIGSLLFWLFFFKFFILSPRN